MNVRRILNEPRVLRVGQAVNRMALPVQVVLDVAAWLLAITAATYLRYDFEIIALYRKPLFEFLPWAALTLVAIGVAVGLYRRRWRYGSYDEAAAVVVTALLTAAALVVMDLLVFDPRPVPLSALILGAFIGIVTMMGVRYLWRFVLDVKNRPGPDGTSRVIVYGAADMGVQMVSTMLGSPESAFLPVAILDDNPNRRRLSVKGVNVMGGKADLRSVARATQASTLLIAVANPSADLIGELSKSAAEADLNIKVLPPVSEMFGTPPEISDIRDLTEADLLGRHEIHTDLESIAHYITGRRVLVTGAGGSIGSELCRQLSRFAPDRLVMLDRDESALHAVQLSIEGKAMLDSPDVVLADVRDRDAVLRVFLDVRPHVVFHAAALKHLPLLERYPREAVLTNVIGSQTVLEAARAAGVDRFVNVSTDKAANPVNVLGYSKRIVERLTAAMAEKTEGTYLSVRFGNVLGSRGSVLTAFRAQIDAGGPVTVTDPEVTRYFMTVPEAVQLVIQAGAIGSDGQVLVLDMGEPVRIAEVAERLVEQARRPIRIVYTGLRPGEKLHEELLGDGELDVRPRHPLITHTPVKPLSAEVLEDVPGPDSPDDVVVAWLRGHCSSVMST
jgi:FlaA1/EpsC-like NDP-sugar epimerase